MASEKEILKALSIIIDPDFQKDIVSLGFVKNISIQNGRVSFDIELTTPACPIKSEFQKQAEEVVKKLPGVRDVEVKMTAPERPKTTPTDLKESGLTKVGSIIAVSSAKGGVGKSTIAAGLAFLLAHRGFKVGLVDADVYGPSVPSLFNILSPEVFMNEKNHLIPLEFQKLKIMSFGFLLGDAPAVLRGPIVSRYVQQILHQTAWGELDYLFIDMPPGTGDIQLTITQSVRLSGAVIVTTRQTLSLVDVSRGILMFEKVNVPMLGIIENMAYFVCDQCHKKHFIFGGTPKPSLEDRFGLPVLAELPILPELTGKIGEAFQNPYLNEAVDQVIRALGKKQLEPAYKLPDIKVGDAEIIFHWPEGGSSKVSHRELRLSCQCALCVNELTGEKLIREERIPADIKPKEIFPLGNYAIGINWSDGHASGIYPYKSIRELDAQISQKKT